MNINTFYVNYEPKNYYSFGKQNESKENECQMILEKVSKKLLTPDETRNYCIFDENSIRKIIDMKEDAIKPVCDFLKNSKNENEVIVALYVIDRLCEENVKGTEKLYPELSKLNSSKNPNIQTFLAGIYRKIQVPDAFGPLVSMLIQNSIYQNSTNAAFDPNEEIGGAILEYIKNYSAKEIYLT